LSVSKINLGTPKFRKWEIETNKNVMLHMLETYNSYVM
jgi:hypothetical protein